MKNNISDNANNLKCSGCGVCAAICPTKAIDIELSDKGFYISKVNDEKCIDCGICLKTCSFNVKYEFKKPLKSFSSVRRSNVEKCKSSSSGICWDFAKKAIENEYYACGARYNFENNNVEHFVAATIKEYLPAQGSKYLQSYTVDAFEQILKNNKQKYVVVGTPCQIASLRNYIKLKKIEENYILIDFFCHGVPSYHLWESYLKHHKIEKIEDILFRDNSRKVWNDFCMNIKMNNKKLNSSSKENDLFYRFFILDFCLNKVCSESCKFFSTNSCADIRFGDVWNRTLHAGSMPMSLGLLYNDKIQWILDEIETVQQYKDIEIDALIKGQPIDYRKSYVFTDTVINLFKKSFDLKILFYIFVYPKLALSVIKRKIVKS